MLAAAALGSFVFGLAVGWPLKLAAERVIGGSKEYTETKSSSVLWLVIPISGLGFLLAYLEFSLSWRLLLGWWFIALMVVIAFVDLERMIIPNRVVLPAAVAGLAASVLLEPNRWWVYLAAAVGAAAFLLLLSLVWRGGMGAGDVKMALLMGAVLGVLVIVALFLAFLLGAILGIVLMATKRKTRKDAIPFGPYLAIGSVVAFLVGDWLLGSYLNLLA